MTLLLRHASLFTHCQTLTKSYCLSMGTTSWVFYSVLLTVVIIFCVLYFYWYFTEVLLNFYCTFAELLLNLYWTFTYLCWTFSELNTHSCYCLLCVELVPQRSHQHHLKIRCDLSSEERRKRIKKVQKKEGKIYNVIDITSK